MIIIKSNREIELIRNAGRVVALCLDAMKKEIKPGVSTMHLNDVCEKIILENGCIPSCKGYEGYPCTICASINEVVVHGIPSKKQILKNGDIVSIDLVASFKGYHGDSAYTFPVGQISPKAEELLKVTKEALYKGLEQVKPGNYLGDVSHAIEEYVKPYKYGIIEEFTGHGIGKEMHEEPVILNYGEAKTGPILKEGMVLAIEPMISAGSSHARILNDGWTAVTKDKSLAAHYEHTVVVTKDGYEILTTL